MLQIRCKMNCGTRIFRILRWRMTAEPNVQSSKHLNVPAIAENVREWENERQVSSAETV